MARYKYTDITQGQFITVNLKEQLLIGSFEWTIDYIINKMDISLFEKEYANDKKGACAYSPRVLLKIILYCYSKGIITSRKIEQACKTNIIAKALAEDSEPDHATIASFVSRNSEAVKDLFAQVLLRCQELDLINGEMFAIDGCKLPSNASKEWSGKIDDLKKKKNDLEKLLKKIMIQHRELDKSEEAKNIRAPFKKTLVDENERRERHVKRIEKKLEKLNKFLEQAEPKIGSSGSEVQTNITDPESARIKGAHGYIQGYNGIAIADSGNQVIISAEVIGSGSESSCLPEMFDKLDENMKKLTGKKRPLRNALFLGDTGYFSEENLEEASRRKINVLIPDTQFRKRDPSLEGRKIYVEKKKYDIEDFTYNKKEDNYTCPAGKVLEYKGNETLKKNNKKIYKGKLSECKICPLIDKCIARRKSESTVQRSARSLYVIDKKNKNDPSEKMRNKIDNPVYRELYGHRMQIIEPVFANITYCKGMNRFTLRTQKKVNIQWLLYAIVHNIGKCITPLTAKYGI
jgi:transposase